MLNKGTPKLKKEFLFLFMSVSEKVSEVAEPQA